jgi:FkbM family methyltransferase
MIGLVRVVASSGSVPTAAVLSCVYFYARLQGRSRSHLRSPSSRSTGVPGPFRLWMASTRLARQRMRFRMRDGSRVNCRILDSGGLLSVHVDLDYDVPRLEWSKARTIVDIGAHVGSFTVWAALRSPGARLLAVEPNPETFSLLLQNLHDNGLQDRVTAINAAVGTAPGVVGLELMEHSLATRLARSGEGQVTANVQKLDWLLAEAGIDEVDVLKVDCEGMEYEIFEAMGSEGLRAIKAITCEYHPEPNHDVSQLDTILRSAGFRVERPDAPLGVIWATR